jgi:hypothetical protein
MSDDEGSGDVGTASIIEVAGSAEAALARTAELREQGWTVTVRGSRLTATCEVVWSLEVDRLAG